MTLRLSIVIPTFNRKDMLLAAIGSVRSQDFSNVEIIVVDGGSSDGTIEAISTMPDIHLLPGPDRGVYDAFNKGVSRAGGDIVGILNSDDLYEPGTFRAVIDAFAKNPQIDAVCGTSVLMDGDREIERYEAPSDKELTPRTALIGNCTPNARFFRRAAMARVGPFDLSYRLVADRDWLMRWLDAGLRTLAIPDLVYRYRRHPGSLTFDADRKGERDIRLELLRLALRWQNAPSATAETKSIAAALRGRCLAYLSRAALRDGSVMDAVRLLVTDDRGWSLVPLRDVLRGAVDWAHNRH